MKTQHRLCLVLGLFLVTSAALSAQVFDFTLVNKTGFIIDEVYVSPADDNEWGEDVLGVDVLANGKSVEITFDETYEFLLLAFEVELYDLKVVDEDGDEYFWTDLKLETISNIEISLDKKGNGLAKIK